jgi:uncharacterized protein (DUF2237 family)
MRTWVTQSSYRANLSTLTADIHHSAAALRNTSMTGVDLHTVCAVMFLELSQAGASLPTPDRQATSLLSKAYIDLQTGANQCYGAASSSAARARALASMVKGYAELSEANVRVDVASASK